MYTVKQLADLAGVSVRTLHYYDEIALLNPSSVGANGYRYYADEAVYRLQQILFYRELGLSLDAIKTVLDSPAFDLLDALQAHRAALQRRVERLRALITTVDQTIDHLKGARPMSSKQLFSGFSAAEEQHYHEQARQQYDPEFVDDSYKRWNSYPAAKKQQVMDEGKAIYSDMTALVEAGAGPDSAEVQAVVARWHDHLRYFYEPTVEILRGLGDLYNDSPDFAGRFAAMHPQLAPFMRQAINVYCDSLAAA